MERSFQILIRRRYYLPHSTHSSTQIRVMIYEWLFYERSRGEQTLFSRILGGGVVYGHTQYLSKDLFYNYVLNSFEKTIIIHLVYFFIISSKTWAKMNENDRDKDKDVNFS